ncbi:ABC transporter substrate-binding protein [Paenibacillus physcomitrellae]|uniref:ABC transporter substrate-binding lipoprotein YvrC n=1 Tax=Paenibacillus physcomitrellae TaxID=1619311 RepID=A0ABQ1G663_9BACL|nr:cobalamin-binding protein [Paenibacillus physcomitrellae]GGA37533.1 putative ABC transporter substrate-binding lipoprotein YvrC [Paenibacillus physcomitrellae]
MNKLIKRGMIWLAALLLIVLAGCGNAADNNKGAAPAESAEVQSQQPSEEPSASTADSSQKTAYPLTLEDASGTEITFEAAPERIISIAPSETESLFALGLGDQIVGVTDIDDYPEEAKAKPKVGGYELNTEAIVAAKPDVVFAAGITSADTIKGLRDLGIKVFQFNPKTVEAVIQDITQYGQITDHQAEAVQVTAKMESELAQVTDKAKSLSEDQKKKVYIEFSPGWTVGKGEFMDELITLSGGVNVAGDTTGWNEINEENIIKSNPDVILFANSAIDDKNRTLDQVIKARAGWDQITAVKEGRIMGLDDNLLSRTGPRITEGLLNVAKAIYPDLFQ